MRCAQTQLEPLIAALVKVGLLFTRLLALFSVMT